jgi:ribosomal protein L37AE/L43A
MRVWPVSRGCLPLRGTWSYLGICRRSVLPYTRFCNCLLDYDCVLHIVNFAILYFSIITPRFLYFKQHFDTEEVIIQQTRKHKHYFLNNSVHCLHRQQLYINKSRYCYEIYDTCRVRIFNDGGVLKISAVRLSVCLKGIVSKLTIKFWVCQKCGRLKDDNKKNHYKFCRIVMSTLDMIIITK